MYLVKKEDCLESISIGDNRKITDIKDRLAIAEEEIIRLRDKIDYINSIDFTSLGFKN